MKILIDTPIWSKAFRRKKIKSEDKNIVDSLKYLIDEFMDVIIGTIRQELLSGISDEIIFNDLKEKLKGFNDFPMETIDYELRLFQNFSFGTATLDLMEKAGRTLVRLDRFFQELVPKPCAEAHSQLVLEQAQLAAEYSNMCRRNGIQGSNTDFLICAVAIRNNFEIFTMDDDFNQYKKYIPIKLLDIKTIGRFV